VPTRLYATGTVALLRHILVNVVDMASLLRYGIRDVAVTAWRLLSPFCCAGDAWVKAHLW